VSLPPPTMWFCGPKVKSVLAFSCQAFRANVLVFPTLAPPSFQPDPAICSPISPSFPLCPWASLFFFFPSSSVFCFFFPEGPLVRPYPSLHQIAFSAEIRCHFILPPPVPELWLAKPPPRFCGTSRSLPMGAPAVHSFELPTHLTLCAFSNLWPFLSFGRGFSSVSLFLPLTLRLM